MHDFNLKDPWRCDLGQVAMPLETEPGEADLSTILHICDIFMIAVLWSISRGRASAGTGGWHADAVGHLEGAFDPVRSSIC